MYSITVPVTLIVLGWWLLPEVLHSLGSAATDMYNERNQGAERLALWWRGAETMFGSLSAFLFGLGPGSWSGYERLGEAHNTYIDWGTNTGVAGLAAFLFLLIWLTHRTIKVEATPLFALMVALGVFPLMHYTLRHPVYWFMLVIVANLMAAPMRYALRRR
jgi:O-antigen ligase